MRLAALHDEERYDQRPAYEQKKRIYGAAAFEPFKSTALRVNFETGRTKANRPITVLPFKSISDAWLNGTRPGFDWTFYDDPARNPAAATQVVGSAIWGNLFGQQQLFNQVLQVYPGPAARAPAYAFRSETSVTTGNAADAVKAQLLHPLVNRDLANDAIPLLTTVNVGELIGSYWTGTNVLPGQQSGVAPAGIKMQGFTDFSAFDFRRQMIDETSAQGDSFHTFNVAFEQRAWEDRLGLELAYDTQRIDRRTKNSGFSQGNSNHIRVDVNQVLPTGQPNPNYGRPFANIYSQANWLNNFTERETRRATGFVKYDFKDTKSSWGKWLGRHTLTGLYEESKNDSIAYTHRFASDGDAARGINANISASPAARRARLPGPSLIGNNNRCNWRPFRSRSSKPAAAVPVRYFVRLPMPPAPVRSWMPASLVEINAGGNAERDLIKSRAALLQSYWLQDHPLPCRLAPRRGLLRPPEHQLHRQSRQSQRPRQGALRLQRPHAARHPAAQRRRRDVDLQRCPPLAEKNHQAPGGHRFQRLV